MNHNDSSDTQGTTIQTEGGPVISGAVNTGGGDFVARDKVTFITEISEETTYDVHGLENPYLGLRAFTYTHKDHYAGRAEEVARAVHWLTEPGSERTLLFVTGASGCGKSSFAQAGLLPALMEHYANASRAVTHAVFRPSSNPLAGLAMALQSLGLRTDGPFSAAAPFAISPAPNVAAPGQINLLVIDQFEELFSQSATDQRAALLDLLESLPGFASLQMHIICTLRADYLSAIFERKKLYDLAKEGVELRAMTQEELKAAIQQPLLQTHGQRDKQFEPELLNRLAQDAAADARYLPLLQVTLESLWAGGELTLAAYHGLANAIQEQAEKVLQTRDEGPPGASERSEDEQGALLNIFLDLVEVAPDDDPKRTVRKRRSIEALIRDQPARRQWIDELSRRRLLATSHEFDPDTQRDVEVVDIIHEALLTNWSRLQTAIDGQRRLLRSRLRFELALRDWQGASENKNYLLQGIPLEEAQKLNQAHDIALQVSEARRFLRLSLDQEVNRLRRERIITYRWIAILGVLLLVAIGAALLALNRQQVAEAESRKARSGELAALAVNELENDPELSILLALEAVSTDETKPAENALRRALQVSTVLTTSQHVSPVLAAAFSPDGARLVTGDGRALRIIDTATYKVVDTWNTHHAFTTRIAYHPVGTQLATANYDLDANDAVVDNAIRLWDANTGAIRYTLAGGEAMVTDISYNGDGSRLASSSLDGTIRVWDTVSAQEVLSLTASSLVQHIAFSPSADAVATVGGDTMARLWDLKSKRIIVSYAHGGPGQLSAVAFSPDGELVATAGQDQTIKLWMRDQGDRPRATLSGHTNTPLDIDFSADGKRLVSAGYDRSAIIWDISNLDAGVTIVRRLQGHQELIYTAAYDPRNVTVATASWDKTVRVWSAAAHHDWSVGVAFDPQQAGHMVTASFDGTAKIWRLQNGRPILERTLPHDGKVYKAVFSPDGRLIATAAADGKVGLWDAQSGQRVHVLAGHSGEVFSVAFHPDGTILGTASSDQTARLWDVATGKELHLLEGHHADVNDIAFSPDGEFVATTGQVATEYPGEVRIWRVADGTLVQPLVSHGRVAERVAFSPDGKWLAASIGDASVRLWNTATWQEEEPLIGHTARVYGLAFDRIGEHLITAGADGRINIWKIANGSSQAELYQQSSQIFGIALTPDGRAVVMVDEAGQVHVQALAVADLRQQALLGLTRWWRSGECDRFFQPPVCPPPP